MLYAFIHNLSITIMGKKFIVYFILYIHACSLVGKMSMNCEKADLLIPQINYGCMWSTFCIFIYRSNSSAVSNSPTSLKVNEAAVPNSEPG